MSNFKVAFNHLQNILQIFMYNNSKNNNELFVLLTANTEK